MRASTRIVATVVVVVLALGGPLAGVSRAQQPTDTPPSVPQPPGAQPAEPLPPLPPSSTPETMPPVTQEPTTPMPGTPAQMTEPTPPAQTTAPIPPPPPPVQTTTPPPPPPPPVQITTPPPPPPPPPVQTTTPPPPPMPRTAQQPDLFQETIKASRDADSGIVFYTLGAVISTTFLIPGRIITCALGGVVGVGVLAITLGTAYKAAGAAWREGCGGKWVVTPNDLRPDPAHSFEWDR